MDSIGTVTTIYDEREDRFKLTTKAQDHSLLNLWLNQRILLRLIPHIINWLDKTEANTANLDPQSQALLKEFAKAEAVDKLASKSEQSSTKPHKVSIESKQCSWLVYEVDLNFSDQYLELSFKSETNKFAKLPLTKSTARQWIIILHSQWVKSEWDPKVWLGWLTSLEQEPALKVH
jgi:hypothetical protein